MSEDLERTLEGMGAEYRAVVRRLKAAPEAEPSGRTAPAVRLAVAASRRRAALWRKAALAAAAAIAVAALPLAWLVGGGGLVGRVEGNAPYQTAVSSKPPYHGASGQTASLYSAPGLGPAGRRVGGNAPYQTSKRPNVQTPKPSSSPSPYALAYAGGAGTDAILRTQNADGGWGNDFLTRQNAAALRNVAPASVAYRRAVRHLRSKGLAPMTDAELESRRLLAAARPRG